MRLVMTHARHFQPGMMHVRLSAAVAGDERSVQCVSCARSPIAATAAGFSIATTASPSAGNPRCSSASSHALAENFSRIPSADTAGSVAAVPDVLRFVLSWGIDFSGELMDLGWGSWEGSTPGQLKSRGGIITPLRGAPQFLSTETGSGYLPDFTKSFKAN